MCFFGNLVSYFRVKSQRVSKQLVFQSFLAATSVTTHQQVVSRRSFYFQALPKGTHKWNVQIVPLASIRAKYISDSSTFVTRCAYAQGRVKRLSPSICLSSKNTAVCCLTARKSQRNSSLPLGLAIYILRKMPRKPEESSVECYGHGFLIAARPAGYRTLR